ncbi:HAD family hydrolase [Olsenella profusa]|uniref:HAD family phosphatase n=1 Tax=Olsenella profusa TaxID=138595 RepID=A0ABS2F3C6_9ACTN|nr:HAD family hydrolase [Olsenella profusa]MBM6775395.1 HAD family phosphatase [Olsenella profusa]
MGEKNGAVAFFDVDGTLVWHDMDKARTEGADAVFAEPHPTEAVYEAFRRMRAAGHRTLICTGRHLPFISDTLLALEPDGLIAGAGAYVRVGDEVVRNATIEDDLLLETARRFIDAGVDIAFEGGDCNLEVHPSGAPAAFAGSELAHDLAGVERSVARHHYCKFCVSGVTLEQLAGLRSFYEPHFTVCDLQYDTYEFSLRGVDKGSAIDVALARLGHGRADTIAFGDSENDLSMAGHVETFVAMGNALPNVKARADYVTDSAADDGVVTGLEHFGLI